jgi:hypothetical protein
MTMMTKSKLSSLKPSKDILVASMLKEELNKLFYNKPNYDAELEMLKYQYDHEEEERLGLHASSVTGATKSFCFRSQIINILYLEHVRDGRKIPSRIIESFKYANAQNRSNPIHLQRIFEEGKSIGTKWQRLFIRGGIGEKEDMDVSRFQTEYDLSYTPDGIITIHGKKYVVEVKSMNKNQFDPAKDHKSGRKQLKLYMHFEGIDRGFVLCDGKDTSDFKIFPVIGLKEDDPELKKSLDLLNEIQEYKKKVLRLKKLPPCICGKCLK